MSGVAPERISATDYLAYDDASTGKNWNLPLGYGTLVATSLPSSTALRLATPAEADRADGRRRRRHHPRRHRPRKGAILTVSTAVLAGDAIRLPPGTEPWREVAAALPLGRNEEGLRGDRARYRVRGGLPCLREPARREVRLLLHPTQRRLAGHRGVPRRREGALILEEEGPAAGFSYVSAQLVALFGSDVASAIRPPSRPRHGVGWRPSAVPTVAPCRGNRTRGRGWPNRSGIGCSLRERRRTPSTSRPPTGRTTAGSGPPTRPWRRFGTGTAKDGASPSLRRRERPVRDLNRGSAAHRLARPARLGSRRLGSKDDSPGTGRTSPPAPGPGPRFQVRPHPVSKR